MSLTISPLLLNGNEVGNSTHPEDVALNRLVGGVGPSNWLIFAALSNQTKIDVFSVGSTGGDPALKLLVPKFSFDEYKAFVRTNFADLADLLVVENQCDPVARDPPLIQKIEEATGFVPLLVYQLCFETAEKTLGTFSAALTADVVDKVETSFFETSVRVPGWAIRNSRGDEFLFVEPEKKAIMMANAASCQYSFRNGATEALGVVWRFYYPDGPNMIAKPVSEVVRVATISATVAASSRLTADKQKKVLKKLANAIGINPSDTGFVIEAIVNGCLQFCEWGGLNAFEWNGWPERAGLVAYIVGIQITTQTPQRPNPEP